MLDSSHWTSYLPVGMLMSSKSEREGDLVSCMGESGGKRSWQKCNVCQVLVISQVQQHSRLLVVIWISPEAENPIWTGLGQKINLLDHDTKQWEEQECSCLDLKMHCPCLSHQVNFRLSKELSPKGLESWLWITSSSHFPTLLERSSAHFPF